MLPMHAGTSGSYIEGPWLFVKIDFRFQLHMCPLGVPHHVSVLSYLAVNTRNSVLSYLNDNTKKTACAMQ